MGLNKQKGNMYPWVTHTWNPIKGKCPHNCPYCYMNQERLKPIRFDESELKTDLGVNNFIFVGSSCDMFAESIPSEWIEKVLEYCCKFDNKYLFQSKNPMGYWKHYWHKYPNNTVFCTTIESNRASNYSKAPPVMERAKWLRDIPFETMVTIEPIMDFDIVPMDNLIYLANPNHVNIGADSKGHNLPEPSKEKVLELIDRLNEFTEVRNKENLKRILNLRS